MALADDLERERAALTMIHGQPFNAEAPPEALETDITPTELHYVRSNFPVPDHDGRLEIGGAVEHPFALSLDDLKAMRSIERVVTLECAGNGRLAMRPLPAGEPWGDYAVSTASWKGALLHEVLEQADAARHRRRSAVRRRGSRVVHPEPRAEGRRCLRPLLRAVIDARARGRSVGRDPDRLRDERRTAQPRSRSAVPADRAALVRRRLGQVAEAHRGAHPAVHRRVRNRALHVPVGRSASRSA